MLLVEPDIQIRFLQDARRTFPDECCGFLFGTEAGEQRLLTDILIVDNSKEGDRRRRFEITPKDYLHAEHYALERSLTLLGVYHSHPKHPAVPSELDRQAAQPFFSYVIVSVQTNGSTDVRSWRLNDDFQFEEEFIAEPA